MDVTPDLDIFYNLSSPATDDSKRIDGRAIADQLLENVERQVQRLRKKGNVPRLAVILVGNDEASEVYVGHKIEACERVGIESECRRLDGDATQKQLNATIDELNEDDDVNGILLQLPLPVQLDGDRGIARVDPVKDVDGIHPLNLGCVMAGASELEPCTPRGIIALLGAYDVELTGKEATVVGRSRIVGRPMAQMLQRADCTVTVCHRHTRDLKKHVESADLLVVATGQAELVPGDWIKPGAVVVDVGITRRGDGSLVGDVEYQKARQSASLITPVPGGVGPMTVATLLGNTAIATRKQFDSNNN